MFEMKDVEVSRLRWNAWNIEHIGREGHKATPEEVEQVVFSDLSIGQVQANNRVFVLGTTAKGRVLAAVIDPEENGVWYCVSARSASRKERAMYQQELAKRRPTHG